MVYLTKDYVMKEFETKEKALEYIKQDLDQHNLSYKLVYRDVQEDVEILIFQYWTLYMEFYIIHKEIDLRETRSKLYEQLF